MLLISRDVTSAYGTRDSLVNKEIGLRAGQPVLNPWYGGVIFSSQKSRINMGLINSPIQ
jgi:hypothetical protein